MTRAEAVTYLSEMWPGLATALGVTATDNAAGWKSAVDAALRAFGVARASLTDASIVAAVDEDTFEALLNVYGARRLLVEAAAKAKSVSVSGGVGVSKTYGEFDGLKYLLGIYERHPLVVALVGSVYEMTMGRINEDYLEPSLEYG